MSERNELILYALWDSARGEWRFAAAERKTGTLPLGARKLCLIDREDRDLMIEWARLKAEEGWTLRRIREEIDGEDT